MSTPLRRGSNSIQLSARGRRDLAANEDIIVLTWLDRAQRDVLAVHPRGDPSRPLTGVFSTRSPGSAEPDWPPSGHCDRGRRLSRARENLEALDGTPVLDVKPVLAEAAEC